MEVMTRSCQRLREQGKALRPAPLRAVPWRSGRRSSRVAKCCRIGVGCSAQGCTASLSLPDPAMGRTPAGLHHLQDYWRPLHHQSHHHVAWPCWAALPAKGVAGTGGWFRTLRSQDGVSPGVKPAPQQAKGAGAPSTAPQGRLMQTTAQLQVCSPPPGWFQRDAAPPPQRAALAPHLRAQEMLHSPTQKGGSRPHRLPGVLCLFTAGTQVSTGRQH